MASSSSSAHREPLVPTINFSMVCPGVYRSGYPTKKNYSFLCALRLRSILYLCPEDYAESNLKFCEENGIHVLRFPTEGNKEPFNDISEPLMHRILGALCDTRNLPLLIHCNKGKHRTGTVVACLRHLQGWSLVSIFEEYKRFASDKARVGDQQYVELYHPIVKLTPPFVAPWVSLTPRVTLVTSDRELMEAESIQLGTSLLAPDKQTKKTGGKNGGGGGAAALPVAATAAAAVLPSAGSLPPPSSPNLQPSPATTAPPPQLPSSSAQPAQSSASGGTPTPSAASAGGGNTMSASLPPASTAATAVARPQTTTPLPVHAIMGGSGAHNPAPAAATIITTTNVMTNATAMAGDGSNSVAGATTGTSSSGAPAKCTSPHSSTAAPPSTAFTALPNRSPQSHGGGGGGGGASGDGGSTGSGASNNAIPPLDADMRL